MAASLARSLSSSLKELSDPVYAKSKAKYFKEVCEFYGLKAEEQRAVLKRFLPRIALLERTEGKAEVLKMVRIMASSNVHEEKICAPMIMNQVLDKKPLKLGLEELDFLGKEIFDAGLAYDWAMVDTICGKVIHNIIVNEGAAKPGAVLRQWAKESEKKWKQRAAAVSYVKLAKRGGLYTQDLLQIANDTIQNSERFVQLGTGWALRELWLAHPQLVVDFITDRYLLFSREGLRYAIEKMDSPLQKTLLSFDPSQGLKISLSSSSSLSDSNAFLLLPKSLSPHDSSLQITEDSISAPKKAQKKRSASSELKKASKRSANSL